MKRLRLPILVSCVTLLAACATGAVDPSAARGELSTQAFVQQELKRAGLL